MWQKAREAALRPVLATLNADCHTVDVSLGRAAVQAACDAAASAGKPLKLLPGSTGYLDIGSTQWSPKAAASAVPLTLFSDGNVEIRGTGNILLSVSLSLYNLKFKNRTPSGSPPTCLVLPTVSGQKDITVFGCDINTPGAAGIYCGGANTPPNTMGRWNYFEDCLYAALTFNLHNSEFSDNRSVMAIGGGGRHFFRNGGYRFKYLRNYCEGGVTGITGMFNHAVSGYVAVPSMQSFIDDVIDGNVIKLCSEEYIGYDVQTNTSAYHPGLTMTTVTGVEGTGANAPTLLCTWDGVTSISRFQPAPYRFAYVVGPAGHPHLGKYAQIWSLANVSGVIKMGLRGLDIGLHALKPSTGSAAGRRAGDQRMGELSQEDLATMTGAIVMVTDLAISPRITNNVLISKGFASRNTTVISLWGNTVGFTISGNRNIDLGTEPGNISYHGIRITTVSGVNAKPKAPDTSDCNWGNTQIAGKDLLQFPNAHGEVFNNDLGGLKMRCNNITYAGAGDNILAQYPVRIFNNLNVQGPGEIVSPWIGAGGVVHVSGAKCYDDSAAYVYANT
ncbi:hypothetical protein M8A51_23545 [Schlegelella sp. S2-27]|uniref:Pectate lyase superfamily protein domain-containing protein n=1 Tax=Caldimonas mangrovi TaxID=2944811 RepID=A0ABT0YUU1_9BURK|nr:hypothetical protein [Caldimonas mangrovi]MCM5682515.1 hypothetical protein [Caldimonas mangrovi]